MHVKEYVPFFQDLSSWSSDWGGLSSLSQELRVHLNHWTCLISKVKSDDSLRPALVQQTRLLDETRHTLDSLSLQALALMEEYVSVILCATAQTDLSSVAREVLEDIVAGTELYNQAVEEQRAQRCTTQRRTAVLQRAQYDALSRLPTRKQHHPATFSVSELLMVLAVHHAEAAAKRLHAWVSEQSSQMCPVHNIPETKLDKLQHVYLNSSSPLSGNRHPPSSVPSFRTSLCTPDLHLDCAVVEDQRPVLTKPNVILCQADLPASDQIQTVSPPLTSPGPSAPRLFCRQDRSSVEMLFEVLVSSGDLRAPLVLHTPTPGPPLEQLLLDTTTEPVSISAADTLEGNRQQSVDQTLQEWAELETETASR